MARFIQNTDYPTLIRDEIKNILLENYTTQKLYTGEDMAVAQIKNFISGKYAVETIFLGYDTLPDPDPRNAHIVMITIDCALYHVYTSIAPDRIPEHRQQRYQDAVDWLKLVSKGEATADLPLKTDSEGDIVTDIRIGSKHAPIDHKF